jgi:hypothetical protein
LAIEPWFKSKFGGLDFGYYKRGKSKKIKNKSVKNAQKKVEKRTKIHP